MERLNNKQRSSQGYDEQKEFNVGYVPHKSGTYKIEIDSIIENVGQFSTAIQVLEQAKEDDEVVIYLQTPGGSVDAGEAFIHAMRKCNAPIHIVATGGVHSMGSQILLESDSFELSAGFNSLIHCGQDGAYGNVNEYRSKSKFDEDFRTRQFKQTYEGFLTEQEMEDVLAGKDIWLDANGWCERAQARMNHYRDKFEAANKPQKKPRKKKVVDTQEG